MNDWEIEYSKAIEERQHRANMAYLRDKVAPRNQQAPTPVRTPQAPSFGKSIDDDKQRAVTEFYEPLFEVTAQTLKSTGYRSTVAHAIFSAFNDVPSDPSAFRQGLERLLSVLESVPASLRGSLELSETDVQVFFQDSVDMDFIRARSKAGVREGALESGVKGPTAYDLSQQISVDNSQGGAASEQISEHTTISEELRQAALQKLQSLDLNETVKQGLQELIAKS